MGVRLPPPSNLLSKASVGRALPDTPFDSGVIKSPALGNHGPPRRGLCGYRRDSALPTIQAAPALPTRATLSSTHLPAWTYLLTCHFLQLASLAEYAQKVTVLGGFAPNSPVALKKPAIFRTYGSNERLMTMGHDPTLSGNGVSAAELQALLMERAQGLHAYVRRRIPADLQRMIAAEDVLQDVYLGLFRAIDRISVDGSSLFDRRLMKTTQRKLLDTIRNARRLKRGGGQKFQNEARPQSASYLDLFARVARDQRTPSSEGAAREACSAVQIALCSLPEDYRAAITLRHIDGCSPPAVAQVMDKTCPAIDALLYRGLKMLRARLGPPGKFFSDGD